jgi:hypothetical protein
MGSYESLIAPPWLDLDSSASSYRDDACNQGLHRYTERGENGVMSSIKVSLPPAFVLYSLSLAALRRRASGLFPQRPSFLHPPTQFDNSEKLIAFSGLFTSLPDALHLPFAPEFQQRYYHSASYLKTWLVNRVVVQNQPADLA